MNHPGVILALVFIVFALCCGIGRGGGFVTSCGKGRRSAGAE